MWMEHCILVYWSIHSDIPTIFLPSIGDSSAPSCLFAVCCLLFRAVGHFPSGRSFSLVLRFFFATIIPFLIYHLCLFLAPDCLPNCCLYTLYIPVWALSVVTNPMAKSRRKQSIGGRWPNKEKDQLWKLRHENPEMSWETFRHVSIPNVLSATCNLY